MLRLVVRGSGERASRERKEAGDQLVELDSIGVQTDDEGTRRELEKAKEGKKT